MDSGNAAPADGLCPGLLDRVAGRHLLSVVVVSRASVDRRRMVHASDAVYLAVPLGPDRALALAPLGLVGHRIRGLDVLGRPGAVPPRRWRMAVYLGQAGAEARCGSDEAIGGPSLQDDGTDDPKLFSARSALDRVSPSDLLVRS